MEAVFKADDIDLLYETFELLRRGNVTFWEFIKPYLKAGIRDPDLITRAIILHDHLVIRLGYKNGDWVKEGYSLIDLHMVADDFEKIVKDLRVEIEKREGKA
jgi:hypothetical protein